MVHTFYKYQGTGNDFVIIDNRDQIFKKSNVEHIRFLCDRRFGIGADGLILLETHDEVDFKMVYFNSDGNESSMCGNGGRCIAAFAKHLGIINNKAIFEAIDGIHHAFIENNLIKLEMQDVSNIQKIDSYISLDTGSPHYVLMQKEVNDLDVKAEGSKIRYACSDKSGTNVNFVEHIDDGNYLVRTYERGVEDETLSCGTGVTAVALAMHYIGETEKNLITLNTRGGELKVSFEKKNEKYTNIMLIGPATFVFTGEIQW